jgi:hypothetical protein
MLLAAVHESGCGTFETFCDFRSVVAKGWKADIARTLCSVENDDPTRTLALAHE